MIITSKDRILAALQHKTLDRIPVCESYIWPETVARWEQEGLPAGTSPIEYLGLDRIYGFNAFDCSFFEHEIYEDDGEYVTDLNGVGVTVKWPKKITSTSGFVELDYKIKTIDDWRKARERLAVSENRLIEFQPVGDDVFKVLSPTDHYWTSYTMLGMENLCLWLAGEPDHLREIYEDYTTFLLGMFDLCVKRGIMFDGVWFFSDMAYANGPMFSPVSYREVIKPGYDRIRNWCSNNGKYLFLHCDGNVEALLPEFIETGFDLLHPLEARAGNDIRIIKKKYGNKTTFMGNINADILAGGDKAKIEDEIASKVTEAKVNGGYIYNIDHSVPPTISFENWCYAIELVKKYGSYS